MKARAFVFAALALAGCSNSKKQEGKEPPVAVPEPVGSGSAVAAAPTPDPKLVGRGEYLVGLLGCPYCHMPMDARTGPDFTRPFAGGAEIPEKFGTWRSPNITQDKVTGIGNWTDAQIDAAIRMGTRPDGAQLFPIMPYMNYNRMTDDDAKAIVAYLRTVKPISNKVERVTDLKLPTPTPPKPANTPDPVGDPQKHGEYLVTLMHCNVCHTPMGPQGPDHTKMFAGGFEMELPPLGTGKLFGANITSDPETGIGKWTVADVEKSIKFLTRPDGTVIQGPMQFYLAGWSKLTDEDLKGIATFVKSIPPIKNKVAKSTFKPHTGPPPGAGSGSATGSATGSGSAAKGSATPAAGSAAKGSAGPAAGSATPAAPKAGSAAPAGSGSAK
ncbi:MAG: c-type cytochrome [Deltaproteobacteria bacterium]|nr:c-type cytochrome [Deltaproteobacteria bacterium]